MNLRVTQKTTAFYLAKITAMLMGLLMTAAVSKSASNIHITAGELALAGIGGTLLGAVIGALASYQSAGKSIKVQKELAIQQAKTQRDLEAQARLFDKRATTYPEIIAALNKVRSQMHQMDLTRRNYADMGPGYLQVLKENEPGDAKRLGEFFESLQEFDLFIMAWASDRTGIMWQNYMHRFNWFYTAVETRLWSLENDRLPMVYTRNEDNLRKSLLDGSRVMIHKLRSELHNRDSEQHDSD